ncbi:alginate export family protein [Pseudomonas vanderleydeniana]|uniref:Alginate export family protein n=1 Tax=Pseudomonas vanderleydeniana TaxID=2745495 RepID=A0A9E6PI32_9PSED|nr:alginate export family protein [Pseudomonas vanderleydeniana]QXI26513.1 alginate export family protein [Pseudomonas vanderleydeniana]
MSRRPSHNRYAWALAVLWPLGVSSGHAAEPAERPVLKTNRWQEDWSVLQNPALKTAPLDDLKYIPLSSDNPDSYLSFGATLRERFELNDANGFGVGGRRRDSWLIQRLQAHADLHLNEHWRVFTQLEDARAFGKDTIGGADQNHLDLRLAFAEYVDQQTDHTLKARIGRQDFAFDLQRFISSRDGPNVRQSFDAVWGDWETENWRFIGLASHPVQYLDGRHFDDKSNSDVAFHMLRVERLIGGKNELSAYYGLYEERDARFLDAQGDEHRNIFDVRLGGSSGPYDWDVEAMVQSGSVGSKDIRAWGGGSRLGYTWQSTPWKPRLGLQLDAASGDRHPGDGTLNTFNPLFPNGYYFSLAGYTGYSNLIHVKPSITVKPVTDLSVQAAVGLLWRQTTEDAVYTQPNLPVAGTAGQGGRWTGYYDQLRLDYAFNRNLSGAVEAVHYQVGQALRDAGGDDSNYLGVELKFMW